LHVISPKFSITFDRYAQLAKFEAQNQALVHKSGHWQDIVEDHARQFFLLDSFSDFHIIDVEPFAVLVISISNY
jgi:hypothetical protein